MSGELAKYVPESTNRKTGGTDVTYVSLQSCPKSCKFQNGGGCYAENFPLAYTVLPLTREEGATAIEAAKAEARLIDESYGGKEVPHKRALRLHISGDCRSNAAAKTVSAAVARWQARGGGDVWSHTHAWKKVDRESWGPVAVLASIEDPAEAAAAIERGYAPALVVADFPDGRKPFTREGVKYIPCPAQTVKTQCRDCRICWDDDVLLKKKIGVAFAAHGTKVKTVKRRLEVIP